MFIENNFWDQGFIVLRKKCQLYSIQILGLGFRILAVVVHSYLGGRLPFFVGEIFMGLWMGEE